MRSKRIGIDNFDKNNNMKIIPLRFRDQLIERGFILVDEIGANDFIFNIQLIENTIYEISRVRRKKEASYNKYSGYLIFSIENSDYKLVQRVSAKISNPYRWTKARHLNTGFLGGGRFYRNNNLTFSSQEAKFSCRKI